MNTLIIRNRKGHLNIPLLNGEGRKKAMEHLKYLGYKEKDLKPIVWPADAVSAYREYVGAPWDFKYKSDILRDKKEKMERNLLWKRESEIATRVPLYVWVFWCPGISGFYRGWWL